MKTRQLFNRLIDKLWKDDIVTLAGALAYFTGFALAPFIILLISFLASFDLALQFELISQIQTLVGREAASILEAIILKTANQKTLSVTADWWAIVTLLVSASVIFAQLQASLNLIFETTKKIEDQESWWGFIYHFIMRRLVCFGMVLTFVFISIISLMVSALLSTIISHSLQNWLNVLHDIGSLLVYSALFAGIFRWMPDCKISWKAAGYGGLLTALLFVLGKVLIGLYLGETSVGSIYGAAGSLAVLLVWVYYSSLIFLFGAEISALIYQKERANEKTNGQNPKAA